MRIISHFLLFFSSSPLLVFLILTNLLAVIYSVINKRCECVCSPAQHGKRSIWRSEKYMYVVSSFFSVSGSARRRVPVFRPPPHKTTDYYMYRCSQDRPCGSCSDLIHISMQITCKIFPQISQAKVLGKREEKNCLQ